MIKIGICGAPGSGKSTCSASIFINCKKAGIKVELVQEYARTLINSGWEIDSIAEQIVVNNNQREREDIVPEEIEVMITVSPAFLTYYYGLWHSISTNDDYILIELYKQFLKDINRYSKIYFLNRVKSYVEDGTREQSEEQSDKIAVELQALLDMHGVWYTKVDGDDSAVEEIMKYINDELNPTKANITPTDILKVMPTKEVNELLHNTVPSYSDKTFTNTIGGNIEIMRFGPYDD